MRLGFGLHSENEFVFAGTRVAPASWQQEISSLVTF
jgi:hypothetical protein